MRNFNCFSERNSTDEINPIYSIRAAARKSTLCFYPSELEEIRVKYNASISNLIRKLYVLTRTVIALLTLLWNIFWMSE